VIAQKLHDEFFEQRIVLAIRAQKAGIQLMVAMVHRFGGERVHW